MADNSEHVPLLVMKKKELQSKSGNSSNKLANGVQIIENGEAKPSHITQSQISPVLLSSSTQSHVIKSRLNQYNSNGGVNSVVVRLNEENETETSTKTENSNGKVSKKKTFAEI